MIFTDPLTVVVHTPLPDTASAPCSRRWRSRRRCRRRSLWHPGGWAPGRGRSRDRPGRRRTSPRWSPSPSRTAPRSSPASSPGSCRPLPPPRGSAVAQGVVEEKALARVEPAAGRPRAVDLWPARCWASGASGPTRWCSSWCRLRMPGLVDTKLHQPGRDRPLPVVIWFVIGFTMQPPPSCPGRAGCRGRRTVGSVTAPVLTLMMIPYMRAGVRWALTNPLVVWLSLRPVLLAAFHADADRPRRGRRSGRSRWPWGCRSLVIPVLVWLVRADLLPRGPAQRRTDQA